MLGCEVAAAQQAGVPVEGICFYPITDYPGWVDERHCPTGLLGFVDPDGSRPVYEPLALELSIQQECCVDEAALGARAPPALTAP